MYEKLDMILEKIDNIVWGVPLIVLILSVGIFLTIRLKGIQFTRLLKAIKLVNENDPDCDEGEVSGFGALCTALSATIGTGNIVGVATALVAGGPGALFWMWVAALVGTATKFSECMLAVRFREIAKDGHVVGGPFSYIEKGMGPKWKWLAKLFAIFGVGVGIFGIGTFTQINSISDAVQNFFDPNSSWGIDLFGMRYSWVVIITGLIVTIAVALVIIGGIKRITKVSEIVVPFMAFIYIAITVLVIIFNITKVPGAIVEIVQSAFGMKAVAGGTLGAILVAMQKGIARGIFSNEAGLGSAPIAAAAARSKEPVEQGLVSMLGTYIDTIVICSLTGLTIVITGAWNMGLEGVAVTTEAFKKGLPFSGNLSGFILMTCLVFFAFTTILGWNYYSEKCLEYVTNGNSIVIKIFRWAYILAVFIGPYMTISAVWTISDIFNGLMALPNIVALFALSGVVASEVKKYSEKEKKDKIKG